MSDKPSVFSLMLELRFLVGRFANWFCGPEMLFWANPEEWEEYIRVGNSYTAEADPQ